MSRPNTSAPVAGLTAANASRPRPQRADARRNRDRVLKAACAAFAAEGSHAPLDEIASRAGVGTGTVYRHFATKEALFEAVIFDRIGELMQEARALADDLGPGRAFSSFVGRLAREGGLKRDLIEALASDGTHLPVGEAPMTRTLTDVLAGLLHGAQLAGAVRSDISVDDVVAILTGVSYAICRSRVGEERSRRLLAIMYDGLRADRTAEEM